MSRSRVSVSLVHARFYALLLFVVLGGLAGSAGSQLDQSAALDPPEVEAPSLRREFAKVFRNSDGTWTARISTRPIHYGKADGTWAEVDPRLTMTRADGFGWRNAGGPLQLRFARVATGQEMARVETEEGSIAFGFENVGPFAPVGLVEGDRIMYANVRPGVDLVYESKVDALKELIVLEEAPQEPVVFRFPVTLDRLTPRIERDGSISLLGSDGMPELWMPHASMTDSSVDSRSGEAAFSEDVAMELVRQGAGYVLSLTPDLAWLQDPKRIYPVSIDPTVTRGINYDTFVQTGISSSQAASDELKAGTFDGGSTKARTLIRFDLTGLHGKEIIDADFSLYEWHSWSCSAREVKARRLIEDWSPSVNWANQPNDAISAFDVITVAKGFSGSCPDGRIHFDATAQVANWTDGTHPNHGIMVRAGDESDNFGWKKFRSENYGGPDRDPRLEVTYNSYPTAVSARTPVNGAVSSDTTPTLSAKYNDPDAGDGGHVDYQVCSNASCSSVILTGAGANVQPGQVSPWTVPSGSALSTGQTYWWRARSDDGRVQSIWSSALSYIPNLAPPSQPTSLFPNTGLANSLNPVFSAVYDDDDQDDSGFVRFEVYDAASHTLVSAGNGTTVDPGERSTWSPASGLVDGVSYYWRAVSSDEVLTSAATANRDLLIALGGDIYHASIYTDDPADEAVLLAEEWARLNTLSARYEDDEEILTRSPVACPASYPSGDNCEAVRSVSVGSPDGREFFWSYLAKTGSQDLDQIASILAPANELSSSPTATGALGSILSAWQVPPPLAGSTYEAFEDLDAGTGTKSTLWIDARTRLPVRQLIESALGEEISSVYWTYAGERTSLADHAPDFFLINEPSNPAVTEYVEFHATEPIGPVTDIETGTSFRPFYLGPIATVMSPTGSEVTLCLARVGIVESVVAPDQVETVVGGELEDELLPDPFGPETAVAADYVEVDGASQCEPGAEGGESDLSVISEASASSTAEASLEAYVDPATEIEADPSDPDHHRAGLRPVVVSGSTATTSYIVPVTEDDASALVVPPGENTTILITGDLSKVTIESVAAELVLR